MNRRAFRLGATMVLLGNLVAVALRSYAEVAFLDAYGAARLPWLLIANAGGFVIATLAYDQLARRARARFVDFGLLCALLAAAATGPALLAAGVPPVVLVIALAALSQVAGLALWNRVAASVAGRDARRLLPHAGAAVTLGGAIAGLGASLLIYRLGLTVLPIVAALATVVVIALGIAQERALLAGGAPGAAAPPGTSDELGDLQRRLLRGLILVALLEGVVATVIDLQFIATLKHRYHGDALAVAVTVFYGATNAILFLLQLAAVPRLLVTRSLPSTAAIHPLVAIVAYGVFAVAPGFGAIATTRTADQVLRLATSRTSQEIQLSAFPPAPRARWKVLLRGVIWPAGATLAGAVLLAIGPAAIGHPRQLATAVIAIAIVWWIVGQIAARRFQAALAAPLGIKTHRAEDLRQIDLETLARWSEVAGGAEPRSAALARAVLARARVDAADLGAHLHHDHHAVRAALFEQLARTPVPALRGELRAAVMIEDDDHALAVGLKALALAGDRAALDRGRALAAPALEVAEALRSAEHTLDGGELTAAIVDLCARDPEWAVSLVRARRDEIDDAQLAAALTEAITRPTHRLGAFILLTRIGPAAAVPMLADALERGHPAALHALTTLDTDGATFLTGHVAALTIHARVALARSLAGAPASAALIGALLDDTDPEVAHAALRSALAISRGGGQLPARPVAAANQSALAALVAHLDARDVAASWSTCARDELERATRRCVARVLWVAAVEAARVGRDPATLAAAARHLTGTAVAAQRRALDVVQEVQAGRAEILGVIERWLRPPTPRAGDAALAEVDPWLAGLVAGELADLEPRLVALRKATLFAALPGAALAALAAVAVERTVTGELFSAQAPGDTMCVVTAGALIAVRASGPRRRIEVGGVVGELAVLTRAPRAATISADGSATILEIDRATFAAAARRAPELVLGLAATLAAWLAPDRPDVL